jgi:hypothetical protein
VRINIAQAKKGRDAEAIGRSRGPLSTKNACHRQCTGNPAGVRAPPGQAHDLDGIDALLPGMPIHTVNADSARGAQESDPPDPLKSASRGMAIPPKDCRKQLRDYGKHLYRARHLIERFFN